MLEQEHFPHNSLWSVNISLIQKKRFVQVLELFFLSLSNFKDSGSDKDEFIFLFICYWI